MIEQPLLTLRLALFQRIKAQGLVVVIVHKLNRHHDSPPWVALQEVGGDAASTTIDVSHRAKADCFIVEQGGHRPKRSGDPF